MLRCEKPISKNRIEDGYTYGHSRMYENNIRDLT